VRVKTEGSLKSQSILTTVQSVTIQKAEIFIVTTTRNFKSHINVFSVDKTERAVTVDGMSPNQEHTYPASFPYSKTHCTATACSGFPLNDVQKVFATSCSTYTSAFDVRKFVH